MVSKEAPTMEYTLCALGGLVFIGAMFATQTSAECDTMTYGSFSDRSIFLSDGRRFGNDSAVAISTLSKMVYALEDAICTRQATTHEKPSLVRDHIDYFNEVMVELMLEQTTRKTPFPPAVTATDQIEDRNSNNSLRRYFRERIVRPYTDCMARHDLLPEETYRSLVLHTMPWSSASDYEERLESIVKWVEEGHLHYCNRCHRDMSDKRLRVLKSISIVLLDERFRTHGQEPRTTESRKNITDYAFTC